MIWLSTDSDPGSGARCDAAVGALQHARGACALSPAVAPPLFKGCNIVEIIFAVAAAVAVAVTTLHLRSHAHRVYNKHVQRHYDNILNKYGNMYGKADLVLICLFGVYCWAVRSVP